MSAPIDTPQHPPPLPCSQSLEERTRSPRRSRSRGGTHGQHHAAIARVGRPTLEPTPQCSPFCQRPLTLLSAAPAPMLAVSRGTASVPKVESLSLRASRATPRCNHSSSLALEPAPECSLPCQRPLTRLLSHRSRSAPRLQSRLERDQSRGRLRARRHPQGDSDHQPEVRRPTCAECSLS